VPADGQVRKSSKRQAQSIEELDSGTAGIVWLKIPVDSERSMETVIPVAPLVKPYVDNGDRKRMN